MTCPDCGYMMTAFDKDCPRCRQFPKEKSCPHCGTTNPHKEYICRKCHHDFNQAMADQPSQPQPSFSLGLPFAPSPTVTAESQGISLPSGQSVLPADYLLCRVCGNPSVQKVSAICHTGTWSGTAQGTSAGAAFGPDGAAPVIMSTSSNISGATHLAQMLMPPKRPKAYGFNGCLVTIALLLIFIGLPMFLVAVTDLFSAAPVGDSGNASGIYVRAIIGFLIAAMAALLLWFLSTAVHNSKERVERQLPRWEIAIQAWNRLFYCPRCAHVFDPLAGSFAAAQQMHQLL